MSSTPEGRAYRIHGLPVDVDSEPKAYAILLQVFGPDVGLELRALGLHPHKSSIVAIAQFSHTPAPLLQGSSWCLTQTVQAEHRSLSIRLEIDCHFRGFTPLNLTRASDSDTIDCIVVSGLGSHPYGSWKERGGRFMWLVDDGDSIPPSRVRLLLYGYDSGLVDSPSFQDIGDLGERLAVTIRARGPKPADDAPSSAHHPIIFIAHSLGGLVVKQAICHLNKIDPSVVRCVYGFIFFGVPHDGLLVEPWLRIVQGKPNQRLIDDLRTGSRFLQRLDESFRDVFKQTGGKVISIFENMTSRTVREEGPGVWKRSGEREIIVTPTSALGRWPDTVFQTHIPMNRNHEDLPKFTGRFDDDYLAITPYMEAMWQNAVADVHRRFEADRDATIQAEASEVPIFGLIQLWPTSEVESKIRTQIDVVAIHGLGGHALNSWVDGERLWLRDFLPASLAQARVFTFGYDSALAFLGRSPKVRDPAIQLLEAIRQVRRRESRGAEMQHKTVFVCHSLGGLIFKDAFNLANYNDSRYHEVGQSIFGVIFLASPHRKGSDTSSQLYWSGLVNRLCHLASLERPVEDPNSPDTAQYAELGEICSRFEDLGMSLQIFSMYETWPMNGSFVVDKATALLQLPHEAPIPLDAHHNSICRYLTASSQNYRLVYNCIFEMTEASLLGPNEIPAIGTDQRIFLSALGAIDERKVIDAIPLQWGNSSQWLLSHPDFLSWTKLRGRQTLWLYGPPGVGKTVLTRSAVAFIEDTVEEDSKSPVIRKSVYFFFDDKDGNRRSSDAFVRSTLRQILCDDRTGSLINHLDSDALKLGVKSEDTLWRFLYTIISKSHGIVFYFVVDAVDEVLRTTANQPVTILDRLQQLLALDSSGRVRLLISSRKQAPYQLRQVGDVALLEAENDETKRNVELFIRTQVRKNLERSQISLNAGAEVEKKIMQISGGNFLHASLAWKQFSEGVTEWSRDGIRRALSRLDSISADLVTAYCGLLAGIPARYKLLARTSFAILRVARENLTSHQLAFLATLHNHQQASVGSKHLMSRVRDESADFETYLSEACGFMIRKKADDLVDFAHVSAKDLFSTDPATVPSIEPRKILAEFIVSEPDAHAIAHQLCIRIHSLEDRTVDQWEKLLNKIDLVKAQIQKTFLSILPSHAETRKIYEAVTRTISNHSKTHCFLYSIRHWLAHYDAAAPSRTLDEGVVSFLPTALAETSHSLWLSMTPIPENEGHLHTYRETHMAPRMPPENSLFRALARSDCSRVIRLFLIRGANVNHISSPFPESGLSLLAWSIVCQRPESFRVLLRHEDVQVNRSAPQCLKPLHFAARKTDTFYLEKLLGHPNIDVNLNASADTSSPLHAAISASNVAATALLLNHPDVDIWAREKYGSTAYSRFFHSNIWGPVIKQVLRVASEQQSHRATDLNLGNLFVLAGENGWDQFQAEILGGAPQQLLAINPSTGMDVLTFYAYFNRKELLLSCLDRLPPSFYPRVPGSQYDLLHVCANQGWEDTVLMLQRKFRLKPLRSDHVGRSLLHWALEHCWDLNKLDWNEYTASDLDVQDRDGLSALHLAVMNRDMDAIELLVSSGANCFLKDNAGMTPAHLAAELGYLKALNYFIQMPQREFGRTREGASLLHLLSIWLDGAVVRNFVMTKRALLNVRDNKGRTPLHYAAMANNAATARQLLSLGAAIDLKDGSGRTALHEAIRARSETTAELLLQRGANPRVKDGFAQNCLQLALRYGARGLLPSFLRMGLDVNQLDSFRLRPLHRACAAGVAADIASLVARGADWKMACGRSRCSPLASAVEARVSSAETLSFIIHCIERCQEIDFWWKKDILDHALKLAVESEHTDIETLLEKAGAWVDRNVIKVKRLYMIGPEPENRWPLASCWDDSRARRRMRRRDSVHQTWREEGGGMGDRYGYDYY